MASVILNGWTILWQYCFISVNMDSIFVFLIAIKIIHGNLFNDIHNNSNIQKRLLWWDLNTRQQIGINLMNIEQTAGTCMYCVAKELTCSYFVDRNECLYLFVVVIGLHMYVIITIIFTYCHVILDEIQVAYKFLLHTILSSLSWSCIILYQPASHKIHHPFHVNMLLLYGHSCP